MTQDDLQTLLDKANESNNTGNYNEAERLANEVLRHTDPIQTHDSVSFPTGEGGDGVVVIPRDEIEMKDKGMMRTYFLERSDGNG